MLIFSRPELCSSACASAGAGAESRVSDTTLKTTSARHMCKSGFSALNPSRRWVERIETRIRFCHPMRQSVTGISLNDHAANRESQAHSLRLGCKERAKYAIQLLWVHPWSGMLYPTNQCCQVVSIAADGPWNNLRSPRLRLLTQRWAAGNLPCQDSDPSADDCRRV